MCTLLTNPAPTATVNRTVAVPLNPLKDLIMDLLECNWSLNSLCIVQKGCRNYKKSANPLLPWSKIINAISSSIISCFICQAIAFIVKNKLKHLVIPPHDNIFTTRLTEASNWELEFPWSKGKPSWLNALCGTHMTSWDSAKTFGRSSAPYWLNSLSSESEVWLKNWRNPALVFSIWTNAVSPAWSRMGWIFSRQSNHRSLTASLTCLVPSLPTLGIFKSNFGSQ